MGKPEFSVSLPVLAGVIDDLTDFRKYLQEQIDSSTSIVMALGSDWDGDARAAQLQFFQTLATAMGEIDEGLGDFRAILQKAHDGYTNAIAVNKRMWNP